MKDWNVPGAAVGIVKGGRTVFAAGFGFRNLRKKLPVTTNTCFPLKSATKSFTATAAAIAVCEGKLDWDKPVRKYIPSFRMHDPVAAERTTMRDLLAHRTGLAPHYLALYTSLSTGRDILERLPFLAPAYDFRSRFCYANLNYAVAGAVIEHVSGMSWGCFLKSRIFVPLGMRNTALVSDVSSSLDEIALGYRESGNGVSPWFRGTGFDLAAACRPKAPAVAAVSNVLDMCRWLRFQLNGGRIGKREIVGESILSETHTPQVLAGRVRNPDLFDSFYAMGWRVQPYRGVRRIHHGGSGHGFGVDVSFMPKESLGVVVLTNCSRTSLTNVLAFNVYDRLLALKPIPWHKKYLAMALRQDAQAGKKHAGHRQERGESRGRALKNYVGEYDHPGYGRLAVTLEDKHLVFRYNGIIFKANRLTGDSFEIKGRHERDVAFEVLFQADRSGRIRRLAAPFEPTVNDIVFKKALKKQNGSS